MEPTNQADSGQPTVGDVGEAGLLKIIAPYLARQDGDVLVGAGDDAAVLLPRRGSQRPLVLTTDMLVEGTHFPTRPNLQWRLLGLKAMAANLSDVAAMGGRPSYALVSLGLPSDVAVRDVLALYDGMREMCQPFDVNIIGGDTVNAPHLILNVAILGSMPEGSTPARRSTCRPGQNVYISGSLGGSKAGLMIALNRSLATQLTPTIAQVLLERHWIPQPRVTLGAALAMICPDLAMIDISDSLAHELNMLAEASSCGFHIWVDKIPFPSELLAFCSLTKERIEDYILFSGEEYELLFCTRLTPNQLLRRLREVGQTTPVSAIGEVTDQRGVIKFFDAAGKERHFADKTFEHFHPPYS